MAMPPPTRKELAMKTRTRTGTMEKALGLRRNRKSAALSHPVSHGVALLVLLLCTMAPQPVRADNYIIRLDRFCGFRLARHDLCTKARSLRRLPSRSGINHRRR